MNDPSQCYPFRSRWESSNGATTMTLSQMMEHSRAHILHLARETIIKRPSPPVTDRELEDGLPQFYDQVIATLRESNQPDDHPVLPPPSLVPSTETEVGKAAGQYGRELGRLGFTAPQVVHVYGAICDALTRTAKEQHQTIDPNEFNLLNRCLDDAIARAVAMWEAERDKNVESRHAEQLGFLMHELRNALSSAVFAVQMIKKGSVGPSGRTGAALDRSLARMRDLIDRSLTEVRLRSNVAPRLNRIQIGRLLEDVAVTSEVEAAARRIDLQVNAEPGLEMDADAHMILSSISNLVRNAIKFTPEGGTVLVRAKSADQAIEIDVQDECGGLSPEQEARLSNPTLHHTTDPQGMGLGLSIVHQAVRLHGGRVVLINVPGKGCVFTVVLPRDNFPHPPQG